MVKEHLVKEHLVKEHVGEIMPLDIQSPITRIRMLKGLSQGEMATVLGTTDIIVSDMEKGSAEINERSQEGLTELGFDGTKEAKLQQEFIEKRRQWMVKHFWQNTSRKGE